jgi:hypothetical protein
VDALRAIDRLNFAARDATLARMTSEERDALLTAEALRVYRRYQIEVVEGHSFCPWAMRARKDGEVKERVVLSPAPTHAEVLDVILGVAGDPSIVIGLVLFPRVTLDRLEFEHFVSDVRTTYESRSRPSRPVLAMAVFHPNAAPDARSAARMVPFIRRSPDPTIQLVRTAVLDKMREGESPHGSVFLDPKTMSVAEMMKANESTLPLHERVARANLATIGEAGVDVVKARIDDIHRDRDESYARLGEQRRDGR